MCVCLCVSVCVGVCAFVPGVRIIRMLCQVVPVHRGERHAGHSLAPRRHRPLRQGTCVCVRVGGFGCVRACVCARAMTLHEHTLTWMQTHIVCDGLCAFVRAYILYKYMYVCACAGAVTCCCCCAFVCIPTGLIRCVCALQTWQKYICAAYQGPNPPEACKNWRSALES